MKIKLKVLKIGGSTVPRDSKVLETMPGFGRQTFFVDMKEFDLKGHVLWVKVEADPQPETFDPSAGLKAPAGFMAILKTLIVWALIWITVWGITQWLF